MHKRAAPFAALSVALAFTVPAVAAAALPVLVPVQGALRSAAGGAVADGDYVMTFALYPSRAATLAVWEETHLKVPVKRAAFGVLLGGQKPSNPLEPQYLSGGSRWVGVRIASDPELPRVALREVPYAVLARRAERLTGTLDGKQIRTASIPASAAGFTYAGSATKGGPAHTALVAAVAKALQCTGCVGKGELAPGAFAAYARLAGANTFAQPNAFQAGLGAGRKPTAGCGLDLSSKTGACLDGAPALLTLPVADVAAMKGHEHPGQLVFRKSDATAWMWVGTRWRRLSFSAECGDGIVDPPELCDGTELGGRTCAAVFSKGATGTLKCAADCTAFDTSGCVGTLGSKPDPALSCRALLAADKSLKSGTYWLKTGSTTYAVHCDMETDGGGWTVVATLSNADGTRGWTRTDPLFKAWRDNKTLVTATPELTKDAKSLAYGLLPAAALLVRTDKGVWGVWGGLENRTLLASVMAEVGPCNSPSDSKATLPIQRASHADLKRDLVINLWDNNARSYCTLAADVNTKGASDSAVLAFAGTRGYGVSTGDGFQGIGQSWETNIKDSYGDITLCNAMDCWEDFVSAYGFEQGGNQNHFIKTPLNAGSKALEPAVIWLAVR